MSRVHWTMELREAVFALANEMTPMKYNEGVMAEVRMRAAEMRNTKPGAELKAYQVDFVQCLRGRLMSADIAALPTAKAFEKAWADAWRARA